MASKEEKDDKQPAVLDEGDIQLLKTYVSSVAKRPPAAVSCCTDGLCRSTVQGVGAYTSSIKKLEKDIEDEMKKIQDLIGG